MIEGALPAAIRRLAAGDHLTRDMTHAAFTAVMRGDGTPAQVAALLMGLRVKGEHPDELAGAATALREAMIEVRTETPEALVDTCGTGGGAVTTFNISTAAALLAAGAGVPIAKHGNRSFTSRSGSADVLEALGVHIDVPPDRMREVLESAGIVFMFAPTMHPAMRYVGPVRREIAIQTVMNMVGPLANPARAGRQVIGAADYRRFLLICGAVQALGTTHTLVVYGEPGMDEISPLGSTSVMEVSTGDVRSWAIEPSHYDVPPVTAQDLVGGEPAANAAIVEAVLSGRGNAGASAAVALNAAGAIHVSGIARDFKSALALARDALRDGVGRSALDRLRAASARASVRR